MVTAMRWPRLHSSTGLLIAQTSLIGFVLVTLLNGVLSGEHSLFPMWVRYVLTVLAVGLFVSQLVELGQRAAEHLRGPSSR